MEIKLGTADRDWGVVVEVEVEFCGRVETAKIYRALSVQSGSTVHLDLGFTAHEPEVRGIALITDSGERIEFFKWDGLWHESSQFDKQIASLLEEGDA